MNRTKLQAHLIKASNAFLFFTIVSFLLLHCFNITPFLINKHSWGESQYAMWASSYLKDGLFFGVMEIDSVKHFSNYIPVSSLLAAGVVYLSNTDLIYTGRMISLGFNILSVLFFYKLASIVFKDKFKSLVATTIFTITPINMYYSGTFYNDPIHFFFIIYLTYLLLERRDNINTKYYYPKLLFSAVIILLTKPTTAIIIGPALLYLYYKDWKDDSVDVKEIVCLLVPLLLVALFFIVTRFIYQSDYHVESNKIIDQGIITNPVLYLKKAWYQLTFHFQNYYYVYIAALPLAALSKQNVRFFFFMSFGFFVFYTLFIKGAIIHQYYSLPFVLPFSIISAFGLFKYVDIFVKKKTLFIIVVMLGLIVFSPKIKSIFYMFKPEYSKDIVYIVNTINRYKEKRSILVSARGHKIFQYYLGIPSKFVHLNWAPKEPIDNYLDSNKIDVIIIDNSEKTHLLKYMKTAEFEQLFCSNVYMVYVRKRESTTYIGCDSKI